MSWNTVKLGEVMKHRKGFITINDDQEYKLCRVQLHRRGVVLREIIQGDKIRTKKQQVCRAGDFLVAEMDAKVGGYGFVPEELEGAIVSSHYYLFELDESKIRPRYLEVLSKLKVLQEQIKATGSTNYASVRPKDILNWEIPLPDIKHQIYLEQIMKLCDEMEQSIQQSKEYADMLLQAALREALQPKAKVIKLPVLQEVEEKAFLKRKVLATFIINQSLNDPQFGDTKFEKLFYLAEYVAIRRNLNQNYIQKVAGPYDNSFTYPFFKQVEGSKWFIRKKDGSRYIFKPGQNHIKSLKTYNFFSEDELKRVDRIIRYFKNSTYEKPEIASTLYAVWNNRIILQEEINDDLLIEDFFAWDEKKKRYERSVLEKALQWMRQEGLVPDGWGKVILKTK